MYLASSLEHSRLLGCAIDGGLTTQARGSRPLIFSQWTSTLDVLEWLLQQLGLPFLRLDGSTAVAERLSLVDQCAPRNAACHCRNVVCLPQHVGCTACHCRNIVCLCQHVGFAACLCCDVVCLPQHVGCTACHCRNIVCLCQHVGFAACLCCDVVRLCQHTECMKSL